ncbi:DUF7210 family protein [Halomonas cerina]|uniref:DUF7210 domain-containing protein n=1 Tax=Halomonas cerina TaxID=447424 RepID=A0A839VI28_9GAMM|nr:hypothetical protein [Halomonas cerina]MBB3192046.1 hypothetical protein [Halomonas cerina]
MTDTNEAPKTKDVSVTLKRPHRHRGDLYAKGDSIRCRPDTAERLKEKGIA